MLLRTRISIFVTAAFALVCVGLVVPSLQLDHLVHEDHLDEIDTSRNAMWKKITDELIQRMSDKAWIAAENAELVEAVARRDQAQIQTLGAAVAAELRRRRLADRFDVIYPDGELAYSSRPAAPQGAQSPIINAQAVEKWIASGLYIRGIGNDRARNMAVALGVPLRAPGGGTVGIGAIATDITEAIAEMERVTKSQVAIIGHDGRLIAASPASNTAGNALWNELTHKLHLGHAHSLHTVKTDDRVFSLVALEQAANLGDMSARVVGVKDTTAFARRQKRVVQYTFGGMALFLVVILGGLNYYMARAFAPLNESVAVLDALSHGDLESQIESGKRDEVGRLTEAIKVFRANLIVKNEFVSLQRELEISARVQMSFLPPPLPPTEASEVTGFMKPAKEIGGDFYDFFRIDEHHLGVVAADVSGKGVPAALFMAMSRTLLRATVFNTDYATEPGRVLTSVNELLNQNNSEELFVTVFYGVLDERNGRFVYANGGHNPPVLADSQPPRMLELTGGVLLAMLPGLEYDEAGITLEPGARLVLITDGVTEAFNNDNEEFGEHRLLEAVAALPEQAAERDTAAVIAAVETFAAGAEQSDDITCVVLRFKGPLNETRPAAAKSTAAANANAQNV